MGPSRRSGRAEQTASIGVDNVYIDVDIVFMTRQASVGTHLGEFEQMTLLAILQAGEEAFALAVLRELDRRARRRVDRGALYTTLDRMEAKGFVEWTVEEGTPARGGRRRRLFRVTRDGVKPCAQAAWPYSTSGTG